MTKDEIKAAIEAQDKKLTELRAAFHAEVAKWTSGAAPQPAVDIWTIILKEGDRLVRLLEKQAEQEERDKRAKR
jgi:hypothetical protein